MQSCRLYTLSKQNKAKNIKLSNHFKALKNTTSTFFQEKKRQKDRKEFHKIIRTLSELFKNANKFGLFFSQESMVQ